MSESRRIHKYQSLMSSLYNAAREKLGFEPHAKIVIIKSDQNMENPLGKTAHYSPSEHKIALYTSGRHIKDILRSLSHELVHHNQNCRGDFNNGAATVQGYAQEDGHLREMEREAYEHGNMIFRDWEDNLKKKGARPLFTSTHYTPPMATSVVGGRLIEGEKMKNKINESRLREIIQGVIQEMFNDDLNEDSIADNPAKYEKVEAEEGEEEGLKAAALSSDPKGVASAAGSASLEEDKGELEEDKEELEESKEEIDEDKEELEESKEELEEDSDSDEEVNESFFPKDHDIRSKARVELNEALMKRWMKIIK